MEGLRFRRLVEKSCNSFVPAPARVIHSHQTYRRLRTTVDDVVGEGSSDRRVLPKEKRCPRVDIQRYFWRPPRRSELWWNHPWRRKRRLSRARSFSAIRTRLGRRSALTEKPS